jgi:hypothetical protein
MNRRSFLLALAALLADASQAQPLRQRRLAESSPVTKDPLIQAVRQSIARLGRMDGFLSAPDIRIGLHKNLARAEGLLRSFGLGQKIDDLILASNRTAELAISDAATMLMEQFGSLLAPHDTHALSSSDADIVIT